eukprot:maker-scaffold_15-snap-gene-2.25-mRNA-1 protein AED:0.04 eAED:0.04 QI:172/1/1/1/0.75/0.6/5/358/199
MNSRRENDVLTLKMVIIGDGGCGKSSVLLAYSKEEFDPRHIPTVVDTYQVDIRLSDGRKLRLTCHDTAGQEEFANIRRLSYGQVDVALVCYDISRVATLRNVENIWIPELKQNEPNALSVLVGNKKDLTEENPFNPAYVQKQDAEKVKAKLGMKGHVQCSAKNLSRGNVKEVFKLAIKEGLLAKKYIGAPGPCGCCELV